MLSIYFCNYVQEIATDCACFIITVLLLRRQQNESALFEKLINNPLSNYKSYWKAFCLILKLS